MQEVNEHQARAVQLARAISTHHREGCRACQAGGRLAMTRQGLARVRCETERELLARLAQAQEAGWRH